jgi:hypothetical protein
MLSYCYICVLVLQVSPEVFALWMQILRRLPFATLTVLALPEDARPHLQQVLLLHLLLYFTTVRTTVFSPPAVSYVHFQQVLVYEAVNNLCMKP